MFRSNDVPSIAQRRSLAIAFLLAAISFPVLAECEKEKDFGKAIECLEKKIAAIQATSASTSARLAQTGNAEQPAASELSGLVRSTLSALCPPGSVVRGVNVHRGGTCNNQCNADGAPVSKIELVCVKQ